MSYLTSVDKRLKQHAAWDTVSSHYSSICSKDSKPETNSSPWVATALLFYIYINQQVFFHPEKNVQTQEPPASQSKEEKLKTNREKKTGNRKQGQKPKESTRMQPLLISISGIPLTSISKLIGKILIIQK